MAVDRNPHLPEILEEQTICSFAAQTPIGRKRISANHRTCCTDRTIDHQQNLGRIQLVDDRCHACDLGQHVEHEGGGFSTERLSDADEAAARRLSRTEAVDVKAQRVHLIDTKAQRVLQVDSKAQRVLFVQASTPKSSSSSS
jgi:hypothetical protein